MVSFFILIFLFCAPAFSAANPFEEGLSINIPGPATPFPKRPVFKDTPPEQPIQWITQAQFISLTRLVGSTSLSWEFLQKAQPQLRDLSQEDMDLMIKRLACIPCLNEDTRLQLMDVYIKWYKATGKGIVPKGPQDPFTFPSLQAAMAWSPEHSPQHLQEHLETYKNSRRSSAHPFRPVQP